MELADPDRGAAPLTQLATLPQELLDRLRGCVPSASSARSAAGPASIAASGASPEIARPSSSADVRHSPDARSRPAAGSAHAIRYEPVRSQRTSAALAAANDVAPAASASNRSLTMLALVSPSISSARLIAIAAR